ncbi:uncharacterized protein BJ171DRAFT_143572 [Polychytrium aggregatum]|uniref:uncharacterized protein n=1 Tax=Polychytrium aggregatum TaxID=110093 RepID=UPI0022FE4202|nr:uncharacterized protein BJ171DRAFT_143572 [Polychytrium aggregatum]KAI9203416.1 hypothetical protein BJ171DRAFT_143572 [Polychytrium aggregatum]
MASTNASQQRIPSRPPSRSSVVSRASRFSRVSLARTSASNSTAFSRASHRSTTTIYSAASSSSIPVQKQKGVNLVVNGPTTAHIQITHHTPPSVCGSGDGGESGMLIHGLDDVHVERSDSPHRPAPSLDAYTQAELESTRSEAHNSRRQGQIRRFDDGLRERLRQRAANKKEAYGELLDHIIAQSLMRHKRCHLHSGQKLTRSALSFDDLCLEDLPAERHYSLVPDEPYHLHERYFTKDDSMHPKTPATGDELAKKLRLFFRKGELDEIVRKQQGKVYLSTLKQYADAERQQCAGKSQSRCRVLPLSDSEQSAVTRSARKSTSHKQPKYESTETHRHPPRTRSARQRTRSASEPEAAKSRKSLEALQPPYDPARFEDPTAESDTDSALGLHHDPEASDGEEHPASPDPSQPSSTPAAATTRRENGIFITRRESDPIIVSWGNALDSDGGRIASGENAGYIPELYADRPDRRDGRTRLLKRITTTNTRTDPSF